MASTVNCFEESSKRRNKTEETLQKLTLFNGKSIFFTSFCKDEAQKIFEEKTLLNFDEFKNSSMIICL